VAGNEAAKDDTGDVIRAVLVGIVTGMVLFIGTSVLGDLGLVWSIGVAALMAAAALLAAVWWDKEPRPLWRHRRAVLIGALVVAAVGVGVAGAIVECSTAPPPPPRACVRDPLRPASIDGTVEFDNLRKNQRVKSPELVVGSYDDLDTGTDLWVFVYAGGADRFYPQSHREYGPAQLRHGRFKSRVTFAGGVEEAYEVMAVLANQAASGFLSTTLKGWESGQSFPGLTRGELPRGLEEKDCVPVTLAVAPTASEPTTTSTTTTTTTSTTPRPTTTTSTLDSELPLHLEMELAVGAGENMPRSEASNGSTRLLRAGESASVTADVSGSQPYFLVVRYSNDNFGDLETVSVAVDGTTIGAFPAQDTGDGGSGWNVFTESPALGPVSLNAGSHVFSISISGGDGYGVEIDWIGS